MPLLRKRFFQWEFILELSPTIWDHAALSLPDIWRRQRLEGAYVSQKLA